MSVHVYKESTMVVYHSNISYLCWYFSFIIVKCFIIWL